MELASRVKRELDEGGGSLKGVRSRMFAETRRGQVNFDPAIATVQRGGPGTTPEKQIGIAAGTAICLPGAFWLHRT
jgi:hypothetical protein